ncbi:hypothetical protein [Lactobacillus crispatus]|nr:hypothetical protein [Lactobacillus crispatus]
MGSPHRRLTEAKKDRAMTAKVTILLNNLDELNALMERILDE